MSKATHERYLTQLTSLPTAAGHEDRVIAWVENWVKRRDWVALRRDRFGNIVLKHADSKSRRPIFFTAHMDHPAFVVCEAVGERIVAEFRGGVHDAYFVGSSVLLHRGKKPVRGKIVELQPADDDHRDQRATILFGRMIQAKPADVITWDIPPAIIRSGRLHAPTCDDLAGLAAGLAAFEMVHKRAEHDRPDVRLLLTRAEEIGFIGAIAACRSGIIPKAARVIALENSKSFPESPIGDGPIVRVGDRTSTFDPDLTYRVGKVAEAIAAQDASFKWQRKLMPGGTCEASAYQALGFIATCLCLPLGNYHNMDEQRGRIAAETIALSDYHGLIRLLVAIGCDLDTPRAAPLAVRLDKLFEQRRDVLSSAPTT